MKDNKHDRLRDDKDEIVNLEDIIEAHSEHTSHFADDIDALNKDIEINEEIDVDQALTFPHPKHRKRVEDVELMDTPTKDDVDKDQEDWRHDEVQPTDYAHGYDEVTTTLYSEDEDVLAEEHVHDMSHVTTGEISNETPYEVMPNKFKPEDNDKETE